MERVRARCCLAVGAIALAMSATAVGAVAAPPRDLTADLAPVAARVATPHTSDPTLDAEGHDDPTPHASEDPGVDGDPHGMGTMPSDDPHGGMEDPTHDEEMASGEPMDMGGHGAESSPSTAPGHGHGAEPSPEVSPEVSPAPADADGHGSMSDMDDQEMASHEPAADGHEEEDDAANDHEDASGGHDDEDAAAAEGERPRGVVLGGFVAINGLVLGAAALTRRRDRAAAALKARRTPATSKSGKDASR